MAIVGILMVYTYATATAAPSPLRYENPDSNVTLTLAQSSTTNALPPDPNIMEIPSVGRIRCYSYGYSQWQYDLVRALYQATVANFEHIIAEQADFPVRHPQIYSVGHASLSIDPSPQLTWHEWSLVLGFMSLTERQYTPGTFLWEVSGGPSGISNGSLTAD